MKGVVFGSWLCALCLVGALPQTGRCGLDVQFRLEQTSFVVGPKDVIRLDATLTNLPTSTVSIRGENLEHLQIIGDTLVGEFENDPYSWTAFDNGENIFRRLSDELLLDPGQSHSFIFGYLEPWKLRPPIRLGVYRSGPANIKISGIIYETSTGITVTVVPEPNAGLLAFGAMLVAGFRRR